MSHAIFGAIFGKNGWGWGGLKLTCAVRYRGRLVLTVLIGYVSPPAGMHTLGTLLGPIKDRSGDGGTSIISGWIILQNKYVQPKHHAREST